MKRNKARTYALYSQRRENKKALSPPNSIITQKKPLVNSFIENFFHFTQFSREFLRQVKNFFPSLQFDIFSRLLYSKLHLRKNIRKTHPFFHYLLYKATGQVRVELFSTRTCPPLFYKKAPRLLSRAGSFLLPFYSITDT